MFPINVEFKDNMVEYSHLAKLMTNSTIERVIEQTASATSASLFGNQTAFVLVIIESPREGRSLLVLQKITNDTN